MSEHVYVPTHTGASRRRGPFIPPLLIIPFLAYNVIVFLFLGGNPEGWNASVFNIAMVSGTPWRVSIGDLMILLSLCLLFFELLKSTRIGTVSIPEHILSMALFVLLLIEFLLIGAAASSVFFILLVMSLIDVVAGFTMSITSATRDMSMTH
ncbi:hypothetical protein GCM10007989_22080 [Devosia pacifica]|uniref:Transmembrane protein n=1 Tax=Devosia pacifica TaxID=1335967 RepID=A0A918S5R9_9HYPH|nr:hypothetical protein [Devosia pacifica]GHA25961.1 hypothetical protein GCM10007989_22080 [Devosia pacifica]